MDNRFEIRTHFDEVKALRKQVEELTQTLSDETLRANDNYDTYQNVLRQFATSQAREQQLLEVLETCVTGGYRDIDGDWCERQIFDKDMISKALALPHDDSALIRACKLYAAGVLEELLKRPLQCDVALLNKAEQLRKEAST